MKVEYNLICTTISLYLIKIILRLTRSNKKQNRINKQITTFNIRLQKLVGMPNGSKKLIEYIPIS